MKEQLPLADLIWFFFCYSHDVNGLGLNGRGGGQPAVTWDFRCCWRWKVGLLSYLRCFI